VSNTIALIDAGPRGIAAVRVTTAISRWPGEFKHALNKVYAAIRAGHVGQNGRNVMIYRHRSDGLVDIECGVETNQRFDPVGEVVYCETPSGMAVTTAHIGPYDQLGASYDAIARWSESNGHRLASVCWEIYGHWNDDPAQRRTDIFHIVIR
jgi:effector-binding domain-containing protein